MKWNEIIAEQVVSEEELTERLMTFGNEKYGSVIFMAGGAASGKGFAIKNFMNSENYKIRDVDEWKGLALKIANTKNKFPELKGLDMGKPADVFKMHQFIQQKGIKDKTLELALAEVVPDRLPSIIFDITAKSLSDITNVTKQLINVGYDTRNINLVWILTNPEIAIQRNAQRGRYVPTDILTKTHTGAAKTMSHILKTGAAQYGINGAVNVVVNNPENTTMSGRKIQQDPESMDRLKKAGVYTGSKGGKSKDGTSSVSDFIYYNFKRQGKQQQPWSSIIHKLKPHAKANVPAGAQGDF